jgi:ferrous iron transport protein A
MTHRRENAGRHRLDGVACFATPRVMTSNHASLITGHGDTATLKAHPCPLSGLGVGSCGRVLSVTGEQESRRRLLEMGFCNGAVVELMRRAPLGDPLEFKLRGYCLCLRQDQARSILVSPATGALDPTHPS